MLMSKGIDALRAFAKSNNELLAEELSLIVTTEMTKSKVKPFRIPIRNRFRTDNVLVITKDNVTFPSVKDVVFTSISDLRKKHVAYEKKRELVKTYDLFMADKRVVESLPNILGKVFYKKKKHPVPIDWDKFESEYTEIVNSALLYQGRGTCKYLLFI